MGPAELSERLEDEVTLVEPRMGHLKAWLADTDIAIQQEVEVEGAGAAGRAVTCPSELCLDPKQELEEPARAQRSIERCRSVQKSRLVGHRAYRVGLAQGRNGDELDAGCRCKALERSA